MKIAPSFSYLYRQLSKMELLSNLHPIQSLWFFGCFPSVFLQYAHIVHPVFFVWCGTLLSWCTRWAPCCSGSYSRDANHYYFGI
jgi:hypothetical protein